MPRLSAENRAASLYRVGASAPKPSSHLSKPAKEIWRRIAEDRPADWFRKSNLDLLDDYAELIALNRDLIERIWKLDALSDERDRLIKQKALISGKMTTTATKLRLTIQFDVRDDSGRLDEKAEKPAGDNLIGGFAVLNGGKR